MVDSVMAALEVFHFSIAFGKLMIPGVLSVLVVLIKLVTFMVDVVDAIVGLTSAVGKFVGLETDVVMGRGGSTITRNKFGNYRVIHLH